MAEKLKVTPQGALAALRGGGLIGVTGEIPGLDIPLKEDIGLTGFAVSAALVFAVSYVARKTQSEGNEQSRPFQGLVALPV